MFCTKFCIFASLVTSLNAISDIDDTSGKYCWSNDTINEANDPEFEQNRNPKVIT